MWRERENKKERNFGRSCRGVSREGPAEGGGVQGSEEGEEGGPREGGPVEGRFPIIINEYGFSCGQSRTGQRRIGKSRRPKQTIEHPVMANLGQTISAQTKFNQHQVWPRLAKTKFVQTNFCQTNIFLAKLTGISSLTFWANFCVWPMLGLPGPLSSLLSTTTHNPPSPQLPGIGGHTPELHLAFCTIFVHTPCPVFELHVQKMGHFCPSSPFDLPKCLTIF